MKLNYNKIILASKSPRRRELLSGLGLKFEQIVKEVDEVFPDWLSPADVPGFLAGLKAEQFEGDIDDHTLVITADTIVCIQDEILGKPKDYHDAYRMLTLLSGNKHQVITGVCLFSNIKTKTFSVVTDVYFKNLTHEEIEFYIKNYQPFDKAGAYGIQEWIGFIATERIEGSFFNVMGLPVQRLYKELQQF
jgi:septum formation protein